MGQPVPSLGTGGWIRGSAEKADALIAYFMVSNYSQTQIHLGNIKSLPYLIQKNPKDLSGLKRDAESDLYAILRAHFDDCEVNIVMAETSTIPSSRVDMQLTCTVTEDGVTYNLAKLINFIDGKFKKIQNIT